MKGIDLFCKTPASTAICRSTDHKSMVRHGIRTLDRQAPHLADSHWTKAPSPSQPRPNPEFQFHQNSRKSSRTQRDLTTPPGSSRYLLNDSAIYEDVLSSDFNTIPAFLPVDNAEEAESPAFKPSSSATSHDQVLFFTYLSSFFHFVLILLYHPGLYQLVLWVPLIMGWPR